MPLALHRFIENRSAMKYALRHTVHFSIGTTFNQGFSVDEVQYIFGEVHTRAELHEKSLLKAKYDYSKAEERESSGRDT